MKTGVILLLLLATAFAVSASYNVVVAENGNSFVALSLSGQGTVNIPLPIDATPSVTGGLYVQTTNGIDITVGSAGAANVIYQSSILTEKQEGDWTLSIDLSDGEQNSVTTSLPGNAAVSSSTPTAEITNMGDSTNVIWNNAASIVSVTYSFDGTQITPTSPPVDDTPADYTWVIIILGLVIVAGAAFFFLKKKGIIQKS